MNTKIITYTSRDTIDGMVARAYRNESEEIDLDLLDELRETLPGCSDFITLKKYLDRIYESAANDGVPENWIEFIDPSAYIHNKLHLGDIVLIETGNNPPIVGFVRREC